MEQYLAGLAQEHADPDGRQRRYQGGEPGGGGAASVGLHRGLSLNRCAKRWKCSRLEGVGTPRQPGAVPQWMARSTPRQKGENSSALSIDIPRNPAFRSSLSHSSGAPAPATHQAQASGRSRSVSGTGSRANTSAIIIGGDDSTPTAFLQGAVDEVVLYQRELGNQALSAAWNGGDGAQTPVSGLSVGNALEAEMTTSVVCPQDRRLQNGEPE